MIELRDVEVRYRNGILALHSINMLLEAGNIYGLVGMNGAGKSTLFKTIMGFLRPSQGRISIDGLSISGALRRNLVAYVPQSEDVDWNFPVRVADVVLMGRYGYMGLLRKASDADRAAVDEALERVQLQDLRERQIGELSGGQKKRVFIARALAQQSRVILLDEPFTGVDMKTEDAMIELLRELSASGHLLLVSTHNLGSVPGFCDQVILINKTVVASGSVASTFTKDNLALAFGGMLRDLDLSGGQLHEDSDKRRLTVLTDDERALVMYGVKDQQKIVERSDDNTQ